VDVQHGCVDHERLLADAAALLLEPFRSVLVERHPARRGLRLILRLPHALYCPDCAEPEFGDDSTHTPSSRGF
jgi:hypothetical protein